VITGRRRIRVRVPDGCCRGHAKAEEEAPPGH
jgi:hypothetical protein